MTPPESQSHTENGGSDNAESNQKTEPSPKSGFWKNPNHWVAIATVVIAVSNGMYTFFALQQWQTMKETLLTMQSISRSELRPWIGIESVEPLDVTYNPKSGNPTVQIYLDLTNSGRSPSNVMIEARLIRGPRTTNRLYPDWVRKPEVSCANAIKKFDDHPEIVWTVIPGHKFHYRVGLENEIIANSPPFSTVIAGCVVYRHASEDRTLHQTPFVISSLSMADGTDILFNGTPLNAAQMKLEDILYVGKAN